QNVRNNAEVLACWRDSLFPYYERACWLLKYVMKPFSGSAATLHRDLIKRVGSADAGALLSNLSGDSELVSLGPLAGLLQVTRGTMSRATYLEHYGHRSPHEFELSTPRPAEDPAWLNRQLAGVAGKSSADVDTLLARQRAESEAAWARFESRYLGKVKAMRKRVKQFASQARLREAVRSEFTRVMGVLRQFAIRAGELTGLGDGVFFLSIDELIAVLAGDDGAAAYIQARKETHARYSTLPPLPSIINGRFDPFQWAKDPDRRSDVFDSHASVLKADSSAVLTGFAGAAGCVEGVVRRLDNAEEGDLLQPGEILVTTTTNIGWTPLFPRAAAIVTDIGAPLSHAAIVARELGIPAVVGCGSATTRLHTGDRVRVDGGRGRVEILVLAGEDRETQRTASAG
ncbi:MAG TPA: PEP-utilizing enzyme, partial [Aggregatilineales bacterium]|nr:PEP-utilizing enzyme [Aggregatilineales bacterium]